MASVTSLILLYLFFFLFSVSPSLGFSLKNCTILYQENTSDDLSLDCANMKFVTIPDYIPANAKSLQLGENLLLNITQKDFNYMKKLNNLNLTMNQIKYVEQGSFINLGLLETLYMGRNKLTNLTNNMFKGLSNLQVLVLSSNHIKYIHGSAFQGLTSLQTLDIMHNYLQEIAEILPILRLPQLLKLSLKHNIFTNFDTKNFHQNFTSSLKELEIPGSGLKLLSITTPICPFLRSIELSIDDEKQKWNSAYDRFLKDITKLDVRFLSMSLEGIQTVIENTERLEHLIFESDDDWIQNGILPSSVCKTPTLKKLSISLAHLDNFTIGLASCSQLRELDLEDNFMHGLSKGSMQSMKQLQSLNLGCNLLTKVPHDIRCLSSLENLRLCYNHITGLSCDDFLNNTHLKELYLNGNQISKLEGCVTKSLVNLKVLDVSDNHLKTFGDTFKVSLHKLEALDMSHNPIKYLDTDEFQHLKYLRELKVETDLFVNVPYFSGLESFENLTVYIHTDSFFKSLQSNNEAYTKMKSLKHLTLIGSSNNQWMPFHTIKEMLEAYENIEAFSVLNIFINYLDVETFELNLQLKSLTLSLMDLSYLNATLFLPLPNLQNLDLSKSKLRSLDFLIQANLSALTYLKLTDNEISVISETVFRSLPSLRFLDLDNNPFLCECSNAGFIHWILTNPQTQVVKAHQYKCFSPVDKRESLLLDFDIQSCRQDDGFPYFISTTLLVVLTLLASFIYNFLRWHISYTFHLFLAFLYDNKMRKKGNPHCFDAFVSYNVHDEDWVYREMLPQLEGEQGWRLCLHHRDFQPGKPIIENITDAIYGSRKTICVISRHYLQSEWCSREIQMASFRLFDEQKDILILLFLEELPPHQLSPHYRMKKLIKKRTYLSWPQAAQHPGLFWQNVQRALQTGDALTENTDLLTGPVAY